MSLADRDATRKAFSKPAAFVVLTKGLALKTELTAARLRELLHYDSETGAFTRKVTTGNMGRWKSGQLAGSKSKQTGYIEICVDAKKYQAHRLVWLYVYGKWPEQDIDHKNGIRDDNRISNLRQATRAENNQNRVLDKRNTSGYSGVTWSKAWGKWVARINVNKKAIHIGYFDDPAVAGRAYLEAKAKVHKFQPEPRISSSSVALAQP